MENERIWRMTCFQAAGYRLFCSKNYWIHLILAYLVSAMSPYFLHLFKEAILIMPSETLETFKMGNVYNIGILSVSSLDVLDFLYFDELLKGVLAGSFIHYIMGTVITLFICSEFQNGYVHMAIMHGQKRHILYVQYLGLVILAIFPIIAACLTGISITFFGKEHGQVKDVKDILLSLGIQTAMLLGISVCIAAVTLMVQKYRSVILVLTALFVLPFLPHYIYVFTKGKLQIDRFCLLSLLIASPQNRADKEGAYIILTIFTILLFVAVSLPYFYSKSYD